VLDVVPAVTLHQPPRPLERIPRSRHLLAFGEVGSYAERAPHGARRILGLQMGAVGALEQNSQGEPWTEDSSGAGRLTLGEERWR
jgi:hypothetical protein